MKLKNDELTIYGHMGNYIYDVIINIAGYDKTKIRQGYQNYAPTGGNNDFTTMQLTQMRPLPTSLMSARQEFYKDGQWYEARTSNRSRIMQIDFYGEESFQRGQDFVECCDNGTMDAWFRKYTDNVGILNVDVNDTTAQELDQKLWVLRSSISVELNVTSTRIVKLNEINAIELTTLGI